ncbi:response regulator [Desulforhopalus sp. IMCC35007]|uniref:response regulator n=1 Tax=Desulforhopalus sp. IMCC35007 TaxID=2569543 RepID=UPI0010AE0351|nr:response regulator [Desulforhopalus sp. IMCC35007]TKB06104.1 response regulator [Desulforhopalus sp. IMCC35007]
MNTPNRKKSILCIDDDKAMHVLLESQLVISGYHSLHAMSGKEALIKIREHQVDLIILDISMPNMDGFQILDQLKMDGSTQDIPVIFLSSLNRENLKVKGLERGADDFIVKPFTGPELIARIKVVLRRNTPKRQPVGDVQGNLEDLGLFELLHMFSFSGKCAVVTFPEMDGELIVGHGFILSVRQGSWKDKEALLRLFFLEKGSFSINYGEREGGRVGSIESLLLYVSSGLDELNEQINVLAPKGSMLHLSSRGEDCHEIAMLKDSFPISLDTLILSMSDSLSANFDFVKEALQNGKITVKR